MPHELALSDASRAKFEQAWQFAERQVAATIHRTPDFFPIYTVSGSGVMPANCGPIGRADFLPA